MWKLPKIYILLVLSLLITISQAFACAKFSETFIVCPGDKVYVGDYGGQITGINPFFGKVTFYDSSWGKNRTYQINELSVGKGCTMNICVGDKVYKDDYSGQVIGVNPFDAMVTFYDSSWGKNRTYSVSELSTNIGCYAGFCVNDKAFINDYSGEIVGVNAFQGTVTFYDSSWGKLRTYHVEDLSINMGCIYGYCVGDTAIVNDYSGKIVGVNPFRGTVTFYDSSWGKLRTYAAQEVSVNSYCLEITVEHPARLIDNIDRFISQYGERSQRNHFKKIDKIEKLEWHQHQ